MSATAAIVTVGSELVEGLRVDTNTAEIARALAPRGLRVSEAVSVGDDPALLSRLLARLTADHDLVVTTGGLGPTHDDITRQAAATALGVSLTRDPRLEDLLAPFVARHRDPVAAGSILVQAEVLDGAKVIDPTTGTAPGQIVATPAGFLVLLPGPPSEMRPMLEQALARYALIRAEPIELGVVGLSESDAQVTAQGALAAYPGVELTVLAKPGDVRVILLDDGAGPERLTAAADAVTDALGESCYATDGATLAEAVIACARATGATIATAESCTGGLVAASLTDVAGSSDAFCGGVVSYANQAKIDLLDVPAGLLAQFGAVSEETARAMAQGARERLGADIAVSVTGIAGPSGGTVAKPVGLVWFAIATSGGTTAVQRRFGERSSRASIRARATSTALDLLRLALKGR